MEILRPEELARIERDYAIELIGDACWKIYKQWGQIPRIVTRLTTRDPAKRMRIA